MKNGSKNDSQSFLNPYLAVNEVKFVEDLSARYICRKTYSIESEYKYHEILGTGSFGEVRKAEHIASGEMRAVKIVYKRDFTRQEHEAILKEVKMLAVLDHPNIIKVYEFFEDKNYLYIVMELCKGGELFDKIKEFKYFSEKEAAKLFRSILEAVNYMHKNNICHRDLKPENIMINNVD